MLISEPYTSPLWPDFLNNVLKKNGYNWNHPEEWQELWFAFLEGAKAEAEAQALDRVLPNE